MRFRVNEPKRAATRPKVGSWEFNLHLPRNHIQVAHFSNGNERFGTTPPRIARISIAAPNPDAMLLHLTSPLMPAASH